MTETVVLCRNFVTIVNSVPSRSHVAIPNPISRYRITPYLFPIPRDSHWRNGNPEFPFPCGWGVKAGMVRVWVAGKSVWFPSSSSSSTNFIATQVLKKTSGPLKFCYRRVIWSERFRDKGLVYKGLHKFISLLTWRLPPLCILYGVRRNHGADVTSDDLWRRPDASGRGERDTGVVGWGDHSHSTAAPI